MKNFSRPASFMFLAICTVIVILSGYPDVPEKPVPYVTEAVSLQAEVNKESYGNIAAECSVKPKEVAPCVEETAVSLTENYSYIDCTAYSYILNGKTASGMYTKRGIIAVDPKVIPLGTKVYVESLDGKEDYGYAIAADTGGAIRGNKIDMWVPTYAEAMENGVRKMRVYILPQ